MDLVKIIRQNRLIYMKIDELCEELNIFTGLSIDELKNEIVKLIQTGILFEENGKISICADRGYYLSKIVVNRKGYGFAQVEGMPDFFIPAFAINGAFDGDDCIVEITFRKTDEEIEGRVVKVLRRNTTHVVGTYIEGKSKNVVFPDDEKLPQIRIYKPDANKAKNNDKVWVEIDLNTIEQNTMRGKIVEVLGQANTPKAEQISIIRSFGLVETFEPDVLNAAKAISQEVDVKNFKKRTDFTKQRVITIDGEDARDFDDAIAVERTENGGYKLCVHIADVSNYVVENSPLDKCAYKRGTSVYFPNMVIPMLPKEISNGICSLSEGNNRLVLSVVMELDKDCNTHNLSREMQFLCLDVDITGKNVVKNDVFDEGSLVIFFIVQILDIAKRNRKNHRKLLGLLIFSLYKNDIFILCDTADRTIGIAAGNDRIRCIRHLVSDSLSGFSNFDELTTGNNYAVFIDNADDTLYGLSHLMNNSLEQSG